MITAQNLIDRVKYIVMYTNTSQYFKYFYCEVNGSDFNLSFNPDNNSKCKITFVYESRKQTIYTYDAQSVMDVFALELMKCFDLRDLNIFDTLCFFDTEESFLSYIKTNIELVSSIRSQLLNENYIPSDHGIDVSAYPTDELYIKYLELLSRYSLA